MVTVLAKGPNGHIWTRGSVKDHRASPVPMGSAEMWRGQAQDYTYSPLNYRSARIPLKQIKDHRNRLETIARTDRDGMERTSQTSCLPGFLQVKDHGNRPETMMSTHRDGLEGAAQHCYQHVDQNNDHDSTVSSKHELSYELSELVLFFQFKVVNIDQSVNGKVQSLNYLK